MAENWLKQVAAPAQVESLLALNAEINAFGLTLTANDVRQILLARSQVLQDAERVEFGDVVVTKLIRTFADSDFIDQRHFVATIIRLLEIFYHYKNETRDELNDEELLGLMREQFDALCFGDLDYLEGTCLANFSEAVRAGYRGYRINDGTKDYDRFDLVDRWDHALYQKCLQELCGW
ncbi:MAG: DUF6323 family protein [Peptococcaceae bacterium]|nr:DUF6323 family protein [Peptococcaceae bacterium]